MTRNGTPPARGAGTGLLDPSFVAELDALRGRLRLAARSGAVGMATARRRGASAEFSEHRHYATGDDLRRIDWLAFARSGEPVMKQFRSEEDVVVRLLVDTSASLQSGTPPKLSVAKRFAASIGYLALADSERAQLWATGPARVHASEPKKGRGSLVGLLRDVDALEASGTSNLAQAVDALLTRTQRPGMLVVLSDFFDPSDYAPVLRRASVAGHQIGLVQILASEEVEPWLEGDIALEDVETGAVVELTVDDHVLAAYRDRLDGLVGSLRALAKRVRATYVRVVGQEGFVPAVRRFVARSVD